MRRNEPEVKEINGVFLLLLIVKGAVIGLSYLASWLLMKAAGSQSLYYKVIGSVEGYDSISGILFNFAIYVLAAGIPMFAYFALRGRGKGVYYDSLPLAAPTLLQIGATLGPTVIITGAASYIGNILISMFYYSHGYEPVEMQSGTPVNVWLVPLFFIIVAVLPALIEEFIMRGAVMARMRSFGRGFVIFMSGVLFMMMHNTLEQLPMALAAGMCLAYFTYKFNSIWVAVAAHFVINLNSCIMSVLFESLQGADMLFAYAVYSIMYFTLMLALAIMSPILFGLGLPRETKPKSSDKKGKIRLIFKSPCFYLYIVLFLVMLFINIYQVIR